MARPTKPPTQKRKTQRAGGTSVDRPPRLGKRPPHCPTLCTPEITKKICDTIAESNCYPESAAIAAGITERTYYRWMERGRLEVEDVPDEQEIVPDNLSPFGQFFLAVVKAKAENEVLCAAVIEAASQTEWQAAAWKLERQYPNRWGRRERVALTGGKGDESPVEVVSRSQDIDVTRCSTEELETLEAILLRQRATETTH